jgi:sugar phosphate isomerase/epimerase
MLTTMSFTLSAFGDEIASDLEEQLVTLNELKIGGLDLRGAWGTNILHMSDEQVRHARQLCDDHGVTVRCVGSPIGKSPLDDPIENELGNLDRIIEIAGMLGTSQIRMFSFYPADTSTNAYYDQYVDQTIDRLARLVEKASVAGCVLLHENEKEIVGDTPERCYALLKVLHGPHFRFIWDPANFVQVGVAEQVDRCWDMLSPYIGYVHIKDARLTDGTVTPAGEGDGQVRKLLDKLQASGYEGVLSLEPHLAVAGKSGGFSGPENMGIAVAALRTLLAQIGETDV